MQSGPGFFFHGCCSDDTYRLGLKHWNTRWSCFISKVSKFWNQRQKVVGSQILGMVFMVVVNDKERFLLMSLGLQFSNERVNWGYDVP